MTTVFSAGCSDTERLCASLNSTAVTAGPWTTLDSYGNKVDFHAPGTLVGLACDQGEHDERQEGQPGQLRKGHDDSLLEMGTGAGRAWGATGAPGTPGRPAISVAGRPQ